MGVLVRGMEVAVGTAVSVGGMEVVVGTGVFVDVNVCSINCPGSQLDTVRLMTKILAIQKIDFELCLIAFINFLQQLLFAFAKCFLGK